MKDSFKRVHHFSGLMLALIASLFSVALSASGLTKTEQAIVDYVDQHLSEQENFLEEVVNINSGTMNFAGVHKVGYLFRGELEDLGFDTEWNRPKKIDRAGTLFARRTGDQGKKLLLIGHLDTVFAKDSPFQKFEREGHIAKGPGVNDMKEGDVAILFALKALHQVGALDDVSITVAYTGDEERVGRPIKIARQALVDAAKISDVALNFESGKLNSIMAGRRGSSGWTLKVTGTRAHSSQVFSKKVGAGAIFEVGRILNAFYEEVRGEENVTFNPGIILGGTKINYDAASSSGDAFGKKNVVAQTVRVQGGLRFLSDDQKERTRAKMREIVKRSLPGTSAEIIFEDQYPAMTPSPETEALLGIYSQVSEDLGYGPVVTDDPGKRGAADVSFVAPHVPSLDGLGGWGGRAHTIHEYYDMRSLPIATKRAALMIYRLTR